MARTILLVEDEAPIRNMLSFVLEQAGFAVNEAGDFVAGLEKIVKPYHDLVLLDWMLPGGSGVKFAKHLKQQRSRYAGYVSKNRIRNTCTESKEKSSYYIFY